MYSPFDVDEDMDTSNSPTYQSPTSTSPSQSTQPTATATATTFNNYSYYYNQYGAYPTNNTAYNYQTAPYTQPAARAPAWTPGMIPASIYQSTPQPQQVQYHSVTMPQTTTTQITSEQYQQQYQQQQLQQLHQQLQFQTAYSNYVPSATIDQSQKKKISFNILPQKDIKRPTSVQLPTLHPSAGSSLETVQLDAKPPQVATPKNRDGEFPPALKELVHKAFSQCNQESKKDLEKVLREMINTAISKNELYSTDWSKVELPTISKPPPPKQPFISQKQTTVTKKKSEYDVFDIYDDDILHTKNEKSSNNNNNNITSNNKNKLNNSNNKMKNIAQNNNKDDEEDIYFDPENFGNKKNNNKKKKKKRKRNVMNNTTNNSESSFDIDNDPSQQLKRLKRFETQPTSNTSTMDLTHYFRQETAKNKGICVGTSTDLEKSYYRLLSEPDPNTIRPDPILRKSLELMKEKWRKRNADYVYLCDQMKAIRQDMTIQRIENDLTVDVYETHARIALENGDISEFNQCQSRLKSLYESGIDGASMEFTAYRILYNIKNLEKDCSPMIDSLQNLTEEELNDPAIKHAMQIRRCIALKNFHQFFLLYKKAPKLGIYIINQYVPSQRLLCLKMMCKIFRPSVSLEYVQKELDFPTKESCISFIKERGGLISGDEFLTLKSVGHMTFNK